MTSIQRRSWLLLSLAALGTVGMFLGPDGWLGIDIGPVGAAAVDAALWLFAIHLWKHQDAAFPADAPPAERLAWIAVAFVSLIAIHWLNFLLMLPDLGAATDQISNPAWRRFVFNACMFIFAWIMIAGAVRWGTHEAVELDERDLRIQNAAGRAGGGLTEGLIISIITALATQSEALAPWMRPFIVANALVGLLIVKMLAENVYIVVRYRRECA